MEDNLVKYRPALIGLCLAAIVLALYGPVGGYDFIALDDNLYILDNVHLQRGLTWENLVWAMTTLDTANWHPLTWLSLMADCELFGLNAGGYHRTSLLLHLINTLLLFVVLRQMTGRDLRSGFVAALFAVHPLNIESVAWIAERKNLLSTLFWLLTLLAYVRYTQRPGRGRYGAVLAFFALGLMAKPMAVSLPIVLLLLDYWPLGRIAAGDGAEGSVPARTALRQFAFLVREKIPLLVLALLSVGITVLAAQDGGAVKTLGAFPISGRIANALAAYGAYLVKMLWPADLAIFYPYPPAIPFWKVVAAALALGAATFLVLVTGRRFRYLAVGWLWYLVTLLPVIGIVQVGYQSMANRYAYVPMIGIFILIAWGVPDWTRGRAGRLVAAAGAAWVLALAVTTHLALPFWRDSDAAFGQALRVTRDNHIAQVGMGNVFLEQGDDAQAEAHYRESLRIKPDYALAHNNLGMALARQGKMHEAAAQYREALRDDPAFADPYNNLGVLLAREGRFKAARAYFLRAMELREGYPAAEGNLAALVRDERGGAAGPAAPGTAPGPAAAKGWTTR